MFEINHSANNFIDKYIGFANVFHFLSWSIEKRYRCSYIQYTGNRNNKPGGLLCFINPHSDSETENEKLDIAYALSQNSSDELKTEALSELAGIESIDSPDVVLAQIILSGYRVLKNMLDTNFDNPETDPIIPCSLEELCISELTKEGYDEIKTKAGADYSDLPLNHFEKSIDDLVKRGNVLSLPELGILVKEMDMFLIKRYLWAQGTIQEKHPEASIIEIDISKYLLKDICKLTECRIGKNESMKEYLSTILGLVMPEPVRF